MNVHLLNVGPLQACCYLVTPQDSTDTAVIDPGGDADLIRAQIAYRELVPRLIVLTHGHIDHVGALAETKEAYPDAQVVVHEADAHMLRDGAAALASLIGLPYTPCEPDREVADGDVLELGPLTLEVVHTPGHTPAASPCSPGPRRGLPSSSAATPCSPAASAAPTSPAEATRACSPASRSGCLPWPTTRSSTPATASPPPSAKSAAPIRS